MSNIDAKVINDLSEIVSVFQNPFPSESSSDGWSPELWKKWGLIFNSLLQSVRSGAAVSEASITRAMDFDGIIKGEILEKAAVISNALRELKINV